MGDDIREEGTVGGGREEGLREDGWTEWGMISERRDCRGRKRGRPKGRWLDRVGDDIREKGLSGEEERKA